MMHKADSYTVLVDELELALAHVRGQYETFLGMRRRTENAPEDDEMAIAALGYAVHNLYNAMENYFLRIAKFFENNLENDTWHRDLINRMALSIEGVRPALLSVDVLAPFHELRAFRHVFRVIYDSTLNPKKLAIAVEQVDPAVKALLEAHERYVQALREIRDGLGEGD
jgi:hypothetical protein